jgi:hypothetical protein
VLARDICHNQGLSDGCLSDARKGCTRLGGENDLRRSSATCRRCDCVFSEYHGIATFIECHIIDCKGSRNRDVCIDNTSMAKR